MAHQHHHHRKTPKSQTLPSSPTHSSSSSDFEFTIPTTNLCPADDLFYKGQLLPLHLSPRISMVRTLLLSSSSTSSSTTTTARHSSDSFSTDSSRPSSVADDDLHLNLNLNHNLSLKLFPSNTSQIHHKKPNKYFSLSRFSSVFRKETKPPTARVDPDVVTGSSSVKRLSVTAKEVIRKYLKKAKPLYEKLSQRHGLQVYKGAPPAPVAKTDEISDLRRSRKENDVVSHSFSGNLRYPRRRSCVSSCPSSMRSSPSHSGILCRNSVLRGTGISTGTGIGFYSGNSSSMEELQSAIQGAIAHCKNSMTQN